MAEQTSPRATNRRAGNRLDDTHGVLKGIPLPSRQSVSAPNKIFDTIDFLIILVILERCSAIACMPLPLGKGLLVFGKVATAEGYGAGLARGSLAFRTSCLGAT